MRAVGNLAGYPLRKTKRKDRTRSVSAQVVLAHRSLNQLSNEAETLHASGSQNTHYGTREWPCL